MSAEQAKHLIKQARRVRDKAIISLFADSGMRLSELANIKAEDIDWDNFTILIWGKGGKQRTAPFTERTAKLLVELGVKNLQFRMRISGESRQEPSK